MLRVIFFIFLFFENFIQCCLIIFISPPPTPLSSSPFLNYQICFSFWLFSNYVQFILDSLCVALCSGVVALIEVTPLRRLTLPLPAIANNSLARCRTSCPLLSSLCWDVVWFDLVQVLCTQSEPL